MLTVMFADAGAAKGKSKKGKKKAADMDAIFATLNGDADAAAGDTQANGLDHHEQEATAAAGKCVQHACCNAGLQAAVQSVLYPCLKQCRNTFCVMWNAACMY